MTKIKKEMLISTTEELNVLLFDPADPQIDVEQEQEKLEDNIREAMELLSPDDDLTDDTIETLQKVLEISHEGITAKTTETLRELGIWKDMVKSKEEPEVEGVEPKDATVREIDLVSQIQNAPRLRDLKKIAKAYDELKSVRSEMSRHKTADDLRQVMLATLRGVSEEFKLESKPAPEKVTEKKEVETVVEKKKEETKEQAIVVKKESKKTDKKTEQTRAQIFAEIFHENVPRTMNDLVDEMIKRYHSDSIAGAKTFVPIYISILKELGMLKKNEKGQYIKNV